MNPSLELKTTLHVLHMFSKGVCSDADLLNSIASLCEFDKNNFCNIAPLIFSGKVGDRVKQICELMRIEY